MAPIPGVLTGYPEGETDGWGGAAHQKGQSQIHGRGSQALEAACEVKLSFQADNCIQSPVALMEKNSGSARIQSVDALRGAIIIFMALDHVRDFTNISAMAFLPTDLTRTTLALFFTRWITHFCAPVFAFTAGIGAFFWYRHGRTLPQLSRFLLTRGLWLIFLEVTVLRFVLFFQWNWKGGLIILTVFWMLGLWMVALAALVRLPTKILAPLSLLVILPRTTCWIPSCRSVLAALRGCGKFCISKGCFRFMARSLQWRTRSCPGLR